MQVRNPLMLIQQLERRFTLVNAGLQRDGQMEDHKSDGTKVPSPFSRKDLEDTFHIRPGYYH